MRSHSYLMSINMVGRMIQLDSETLKGEGATGLRGFDKGGLEKLEDEQVKDVAGGSTMWEVASVATQRTKW